MKKYQTVAAGTLLPFAIVAQSLLTTPEAKNQLPPETSQSWYTQVVKNIAASEYNIQYSETNCKLQLHNRQNNFFADLQGSGFSIIPKPECEAPIRLTIQGIHGNGVIALEPHVKGYKFQNENDVVFWHKGFKEQYVNTPNGLRQNFIVEENLQCEEIRVLLNVEGAVTSTLSNTQINLTTPKGTIIQYKDLRVWDANGRPLQAYMQLLPDNQIALVVSHTQNAAYPITIDPLSSTPDWQVESNQIGALMGCSVAGAGDVNGDGYSDVIVGARHYSNGQFEEGAAFVYYGSVSGLSSNPAWQVESNKADANFGNSVAGAGDVNGDNIDDVIVGALNYSNGQTFEGAAFVYHGSTLGLSTIPSWQVESNQAQAVLGNSVASAGDVNGDGYSDVLVGAMYSSYGQSLEGAAFVYYGSAIGLSSVAGWQAESNQVNGNMGFSVAGAGDVNGDGYGDIIVGVPGYNDGQARGAAFIYHGSTLGLSTSAVTTLVSSQAVISSFGRPVAGAGDVNADGYSDVIVGEMGYENGQNQEGAAFVYLGSAQGLNPISVWHVESNQSYALLGIAVAGAGDVNGDGYSDVIVGASYYDNGIYNDGMVFLYHGTSRGLSDIPVWELQGGTAETYLGDAVSTAGDVNGDGYSDVIFGASNYENGQTSEGAAFAFYGSMHGLITPEELIAFSKDPFAYPSEGNLKILMNGLSGENVKISVLDMAGRLVYSKTETNVETEIRIPLAATRGLYVVQIENKSTYGLYIQKLLW